MSGEAEPSSTSGFMTDGPDDVEDYISVTLLSSTFSCGYFVFSFFVFVLVAEKMWTTEEEIELLLLFSMVFDSWSVENKQVLVQNELHTCV